MKKLTKEESDRIDLLSKEMDELKPMMSRYYEASHEYYELCKRRDEQKKWADRNRLSIMCQYQEPEYPYVGQSGEDGSAYFHNQQDAEDLIKALRASSSYGKGYVLKWSEPGRYVVEPSYRYDHDRDMVYTATFRRMDEQD